MFIYKYSLASIILLIQLAKNRGFVNIINARTYVAFAEGQKPININGVLSI